MEGQCDQAIVVHEENAAEPATQKSITERRTKKEIMKEVKRLLWLAGPLTVVTTLQYSLQVTLMFAGHSSELVLSGASMAISSVSVTGTILLIGMSSALDTAQSFGAEQRHMLGIQTREPCLFNSLSVLSFRGFGQILELF